MTSTTYFKTYEDREAEFRKNVHSLLPRKHSGPALFLKDMMSIGAGMLNVPVHPIACITSNPKDSLAYSYVDDLLTATSLFLKTLGRAERLESVISNYKIGPIRGQEIQTLSGGEVVRLALARNALLSSISNKAVVSSPLTWLAKEQAYLYQEFLNAFQEDGKQVSVLRMEGEDDDTPAAAGQIDGVQFELSLTNVRILLSSARLGKDMPATWAGVTDFSRTLNSPCLISGDNGAGKSLIAKAISGAIPFAGTGHITTAGYRGRSRLLFQDVIMQALLRPFYVLTASARCAQGTDLSKTYSSLAKAFASHFTSQGKAVPYIGDTDSETKTLLEYKFMLSATRICERPTALILDEADWGLTKDSAVAFVYAVTKTAHEFGVPIILVSHKGWWDSFAKSRLTVVKEIAAMATGTQYVFRITEQPVVKGVTACVGS